MTIFYRFIQIKLAGYKEITLLFVNFRKLFCITPILLHEKIMLLIQIIAGIIEAFAKSLEVYDFPFAQETKRCKNGRVFCQINKVFISAPCFLFCCTFVCVTYYVKWLWNNRIRALQATVVGAISIKKVPFKTVPETLFSF